MIDRLNVFDDKCVNKRPHESKKNITIAPTLYLAKHSDPTAMPICKLM